MEFQTGDMLLDKYRVTKVIRSGGFGIVYICKYISEPSFEVAVKSFKDEYFMREEVIKDFYHEAEVWVKLGSHHNIVRANLVTEIAEKPHVILEYVDGGSLRDRLVDGQLNISDALVFAIQFCDGMIFANNKDLGWGKHGIVHRDVKPENIMLTKENVVKITDFGLVKALGRPSSENPAGTPEYMSPEQFATMDVDTRSDIYSFGIVLDEMLFGRRPFPEPEDPKLRWEHYRHCHCDVMPLFPTPKESVGPQFLDLLERFKQVISKCLKKNPKERYKSFKELRDNLEEIFQAHPEIKSEDWKRRDIGKIRKIVESISPQLFQPFQGTEAQRLLLEATSLLNLGKRKEALQYLDKALKIDPKLAKAWISKAIALGELGMLTKALECFDQALRIDPRDHAGWSGKGAVLWHLGRFGEALECFDTALGLCPPDARFTSAHILCEKAEALLEMGRPEQALACCEKALKMDSTCLGVWNAKGAALAELNRDEEAVKCFDKALQMNPKSIDAWNQKAISLRRLGKVVEAIRCLDKALEIDPRNVAVLENKGNFLLSLEEYDEAIMCFERALENDPNEVSVWDALGDAFYFSGRFKDALRCRDRALEIDANNADRWANKGAVLNDMGKCEEAMRCCNRSLEMDPRNSLAWFLRGVILTTTGLQTSNADKLHKGIECLDNALKCEPPNSVDVWVWKGIALDGLGRYEDALKCFQKALLIESNHFLAWHSRGNSLFKLEKYSEAMDCYEKALRINPKSADAWYNKGLTLALLGRRREAFECVNKCLECNPDSEVAKQLREALLKSQ